MFSTESASLSRSRFFAAFGRFMAPVPSAGGDKINWINYKTGIKMVFIRIETSGKGIGIGFQVQHTDPEVRLACFKRFLDLQQFFGEIVVQNWTWSKDYSSGEGQIVSRIYDRMENVKPRLIALDAFWFQVKEQFE